MFALDGLGCKDSVQVESVQKVYIQKVHKVCSSGTLACTCQTPFAHRTHAHVPNIGNTCLKSKLSNVTVPSNMNVPFLKAVC